MRLPIPLAPLAITVQLERRRFGSLRPRITVLGLLIVTAVLAVFMARVTLPARRARAEYALRIIGDHVALLNRAAEEASAREQDLRRRFAKCLADADKEEREAAKWPEGSENREAHRNLARLWYRAAGQVPLPFADLAARKSRALRSRAEAHQNELRLAGKSLERLEALARKAETQPDTPEWTRLELADQLAALKETMEAER